MAQAVKIQVEARDPQKNKGTGTRASRKLRSQGKIPAIIYGHKEKPATITISRESVLDMIKRSVHLAELQFGGTSETVVIRDIQWDYLGKEILHLDFARVSVGEMVDADVKLDFKGTAPGVAEGGVVEILLHSVHVQCRADAIPDSLRVDISQLSLGKTIHIGELVMPEGVTVKGDPETAVVHVVEPAVEPPTTEAPEGAQPEVIKAERKEGTEG